MTTGLRIVHCFRSPVGGIFRHVRDLTEAQAAAGHQVGIICDSSTGGELEERYFRGMDGMLALGVRRLPMQRHIGPGDLAVAWRTYKYIKELQPDVLHGHGAKGGMLVRLFGSLLRVSRFRVARLYSPHGGVLHYDRRSMAGKVFFGIERALELATDHLLFVSDYERRTFHAKIGEPRTASSLVYNGLREPEFEPVMPRGDAADFLYIGMMRDLKGPDIFLDALALAEKETGRSLSAVMIGDGGDLQKYKDQAERLGFGPRVTFLAPMQAREGFSHGRVIVVPSRAEAMPYIVLEALAAGKTMIATAVGGIPEIFEAGSPAMVAPSPAAIAEAMVAALENESAFAALMPGAETLRARFGAGVMARQVEEAYRACLPASR
ncbi:glycosyltransferase [Aquamicrobium sp. LC103]|uniref:glycosyltransferase n=1 Tax=Aquamicrobium sp. LC103 TaxID=1120658 RepID=UPI00063EAA28|nr:glycosyltransferase [Aquamicrobium sp. LC103]TKT81435.1 glycosyltransferase family 1 protein [Aquamicrobium sp. LC103]